jgi:hypothetical protein
MKFNKKIKENKMTKFREDFKGIALKVNTELSIRVQEIVFNKGGIWADGLANFQNLDKEYLIINEHWNLYYTDKDGYEYDEYYPKGSAIDFIISNGEQTWLPRFGDLVEFSDDNATWVQEQYKCYIPNAQYPYFTTNGNYYRYCRVAEEKEEECIKVNKKDYEELVRIVEKLKGEEQ